MIEALDVLAWFLGEVARWVWSLFWWWGPLVGAFLVAGGWLVLRPGRGRHRSPGSSGGENPTAAGDSTVALAVVPPPADTTDG